MEYKSTVKETLPHVARVIKYLVHTNVTTITIFDQDGLLIEKVHDIGTMLKDGTRKEETVWEIN